VVDLICEGRLLSIKDMGKIWDALTFKSTMGNMIYVLRQVEPGYNTWIDDDIEKQIKAIKECGYVWFEKKERVAFKHSKTGLYLLIDGLNFYKPEEIKKIYREVWSKANPDQIKKIDSTAQKLQEAIENNSSDEEIGSILENHQNKK
jgi:hypothetical protein